MAIIPSTPQTLVEGVDTHTIVSPTFFSLNARGVYTRQFARSFIVDEAENFVSEQDEDGNFSALFARFTSRRYSVMVTSVAVVLGNFSLLESTSFWNKDKKRTIEGLRYHNRRRYR
jgi:hypothetical protein